MKFALVFTKLLYLLSLDDIVSATSVSLSWTEILGKLMIHLLIISKLEPWAVSERNAGYYNWPEKSLEGWKSNRLVKFFDFYLLVIFQLCFYLCNVDSDATAHAYVLFLKQNINCIEIDTSARKYYQKPVSELGFAFRPPL